MLKHLQHDQKTHGNKRAGRRAYVATYREARASGASVSDARTKAKEAATAKRQARDERYKRMKKSSRETAKANESTIDKMIRADKRLQTALKKADPTNFQHQKRIMRMAERYDKMEEQRKKEDPKGNPSILWNTGNSSPAFQQFYKESVAHNRTVVDERMRNYQPVQPTRSTETVKVKGNPTSVNGERVGQFFVYQKPDSYVTDFQDWDNTRRVADRNNAYFVAEKSGKRDYEQTWGWDDKADRRTGKYITSGSSRQEAMEAAQVFNAALGNNSLEDYPLMWSAVNGYLLDTQERNRERRKAAGRAGKAK